MPAKHEVTITELPDIVDSRMLYKEAADLLVDVIYEDSVRPDTVLGYMEDGHTLIAVNKHAELVAVL